MELLEREPQLVELAGLLRAASRGEGRLAFVAGEAGVGKSAFVRAFAGRVEIGTRVYQGACDPLSTPRPLAPLLDIAAARSEELARALEGDRRHEAFQALLKLLERGPGPAVVILEDLHWADEATLDLLRFLARRLATTRTLLVGTYRDDEVPRHHPLRVALGDAATFGSVQRIQLAPLSPAAVATLAADAPVAAEELHRRTGGNPFFVTELLADGERALPTTVREAVLARAARLPADAQRILDAGSVLGARLRPELLAEVADAPADAIDRCVARGMLVAEGPTLAFRHELAREAIYAELEPQARARLHARALAALRVRAGTDAAELAHHADAAGDGSAVVRFAPEAARRAAEVDSHREAAAQYARAARYAELLPQEERARLLEAYASECLLCDRVEDAIEAQREATDVWKRLGEPLAEGHARSQYATYLVSAGRNAEAERASREAITLLERFPPGPELAIAYAAQAGLRMLNRDNAEAERWSERAIELGTRFGVTRVVVAGRNRLGSALLVQGDDAGRGHLEESLRLAEEAGLSSHVGMAYINLGSGLGEFYRFTDAEAYLERGIAYCLDHDLDAHRLYMLAWLALTRLHQGRWAEAAPLALAVLERPGSAAISRIMALVALALLRVRRGDPEARPVLDEALELARGTDTLQRLAPVRAARAEAAWLAGDATGAAHEARAAFDLALRHRHPWFAGILAYWCWKGGDALAAPSIAAEPFALQMEGRADAAARAWRNLGCPYEAARALSESPEEDDLRAALAEFERLGARPAATEVARRLRELGARGIPRGPRPETRSNPASLTPRELEVLPLLAEGSRNAAIGARLGISPKTVGHHVSSILAKLDVSNRGEAVREAARRGITAQPRDPETPA